MGGGGEGVWPGGRGEGVGPDGRGEGVGPGGRGEGEEPEVGAAEKGLTAADFGMKAARKLMRARSA
jgi:hypothetical protein